MKALLDTNIILLQEVNKDVSQDVRILYRWLERGGYTKCVHPLIIEEVGINANFFTGMNGYELLAAPSPLAKEVLSLSQQEDHSDTDKKNTLYLMKYSWGKLMF